MPPHMSDAAANGPKWSTFHMPIGMGDDCHPKCISLAANGPKNDFSHAHYKVGKDLHHTK